MVTLCRQTCSKHEVLIWRPNTWCKLNIAVQTNILEDRWKHEVRLSYSSNWGRLREGAKSYVLMSDLGFPDAFKLPRYHEVVN